MKYAITAHKECETNHGFTVEEPVKELNADTPEDAEATARKLFKEDNYSSIYIDFAHPEGAVCYYNPLYGHQSEGVNWVRHLED